MANGKKEWEKRKPPCLYADKGVFLQICPVHYQD